MTPKEWAAERERVRPNVAQSNFTRASASEAVSNARRLEWLLFGVRDADRARLTAARTGTVTLSHDELEDIMDRMGRPVSHREVIEKALAEGLPVPACAMEEFTPW